MLLLTKPRTSCLYSIQGSLGYGTHSPLDLQLAGLLVSGAGRPEGAAVREPDMFGVFVFVDMFFVVIVLVCCVVSVREPDVQRAGEGQGQDRGVVQGPVRRRYLSNATCLVWPHVFSTALLGPIRLIEFACWLRTTGVNTNRAAAKGMTFDRLGKKVHPGTLGNIKIGQRRYPKSPSVKKHEIPSDPI